MEDKRIIELFWERSEAAIKESAKKYGRYLRRIAFNVLGNEQDCEEVENDTYLRAWNSIPPERPSSLKGYLAVICRNLACNRYNINTAKKRGEYDKALSELSDALPEDDGRDLAESVALRRAVEKFLLSLDEKTRNIFLQRYFCIRNPVQRSKVKEAASAGAGASWSSMKSPRWESSSSPIGVSKETGS